MDYEVYYNLTKVSDTCHTLAEAKQLARKLAREHNRPATVFDRSQHRAACVIASDGTEKASKGYTVRLSP